VRGSFVKVHFPELLPTAKAGVADVFYISRGYVLYDDALVDGDVCLPKVVGLAVLVVGWPCPMMAVRTGAVRGDMEV